VAADIRQSGKTNVPRKNPYFSSPLQCGKTHLVIKIKKVDNPKNAHYMPLTQKTSQETFYIMKTFINYTLTPVLCAIMVLLAVVVVVKDQKIDDLKHQLVLAKQTAEARKNMVEEARLLQKAMSAPPVRKVTVTAYNPTTDQCDSDPLIAASMRKVRTGTIAVSRDLFDQGWVFGRKVRIEGIGIFEINDLMNKRFTQRIDIFMWDENQARQFGKKNIKAALLEI